MKEYHKIQSVWMRDPASKNRTFLEGQWSTPEIGYLADAQWEFTEKVDGTNIRVHCDGDKVRFGGRTDDASVPTRLFDKLNEMFVDDGRANSVLKSLGEDATLFGEGYGAKINKGGGNYISDGVSFRLFDVSIGAWWLRRDDVYDVARKLGVGHVPIFAEGTLHEAIDLARNGFKSFMRDTPPEGLVMRTAVDMFDRQGHRIITKVKLKDFPKA